MWNGYMMQHMWGAGWMSMGLYMGAFWVIVLLAVAALVWAFTRGGRSGTPQQGDDRALKMLEERYARGEIGKEEFLEKRRYLEH